VLCYGEDAVFVVVKILRGVIDELEFLHYFVFVFTFVVRAGIYATALSSSTISYAASTGSNIASLFSSFLIEHNSSQHAAKIPCWTALFSLTSTQATKSMVAPLLAQEISKRALRDWGNFKYTENGMAQVRVVEAPVLSQNAASIISSTGSKNVVVNVAAGEQCYGEAGVPRTSPTLY
jgi:hypothetical protein